MAVGGERFMRMMAFFDLPTLTKTDRRNASRFRSFLIKDGYTMLQLSVYSRICKGQDDVEKHARRLKSLTPICRLPIVSASIAYEIWKGSYNSRQKDSRKRISIAYEIWKGSYNACLPSEPAFLSIAYEIWKGSYN